MRHLGFKSSPLYYNYRIIPKNKKFEKCGLPNIDLFLNNNNNNNSIVLVTYESKDLNIGCLY